MSFVNKVVAVTGAGSGLGATIAKHFARLDATLCLIDKNADSLTRVCEECESLGNAEVLMTVVDLCEDAGVRRALDGALRRRGRLDVLVNCAGAHGAGGVRRADIVERYDRVMAINLRGVIALTSRAVPALVESKGCIINISSIAATLPLKNMLPYSLSKCGVVNFTKSVALELAEDGVRVNCISPGPVQTNLLINAGMQESEGNSFWEAMRQISPLKRNTKAEDVAELVVFLASDRAESITGSEFVVDAGFLLKNVANSPDVPMDAAK